MGVPAKRPGDRLAPDQPPLDEPDVTFGSRRPDEDRRLRPAVEELLLESIVDRVAVGMERLADRLLVLEALEPFGERAVQVIADSPVETVASSARPPER
jgi:hypothetical protein